MTSSLMVSLGGAVVGLAGLAPMALLPTLHEQTERARQTAFLGYDLALRRRLKLEVTGRPRVIDGRVLDLSRDGVSVDSTSASLPTTPPVPAELNDRTPTMLE